MTFNIGDVVHTSKDKYCEIIKLEPNINNYFETNYVVRNLDNPKNIFMIYEIDLILSSKEEYLSQKVLES